MLENKYFNDICNILYSMFIIRSNKYIFFHSSMNDLKAIYAPEWESSITIDKIVDVVLGTKSRYIKGLGYSPKPDTTRATQRKLEELEYLFKKVKEEDATI